MNKPLSQHLVAFFICAVTVVGCSSSPGPDAMSPGAGTGSSVCTACHAPGSAIDPLTTNGTGASGKHVAHVTSMGFACEACHFNYINLTTHASGTLDTTNPGVLIVYFDPATNPTGSWNDALGTCSSLNCHGTDTLDWYGTSVAGYQSCTSCHSYPIGTRRRVTGALGDFGLNPAIVSKHVTTTGDPAPAQCLVCHDQTNHTQGTVRLRNADNVASIIVYNPASPASLEPFCLSCHDTLGATSTFLAGGNALKPFNDNNTLGSVPNVAGNKIQSYWTGTNNRHQTSGGLTCAGTGAILTGCHGNNGSINMHGSVNKGLLTQNLTLPIPYTQTYAYNDYKLCFDCHTNYATVSPQVVLGYNINGKYNVTSVPTITSYVTSAAIIQSLFRDQYINPANPLNFPPYWGGIEPTPINYNDTMSIGGEHPYLPLHNYHLFSIVADPLFSPLPNLLNWKYRGDALQTGRITCVTCHNVHGTNGSSVRSTFDEFLISPIPLIGSGLDTYNTMTFDNYSTVMDSYPMNCNAKCHEFTGQTFYWNVPANE